MHIHAQSFRGSIWHVEILTCLCRNDNIFHIICCLLELFILGGQHPESVMLNSQDFYYRMVASTKCDLPEIIHLLMTSESRILSSRDVFCQNDYILQVRCRHPEINYLRKMTSTFPDVVIPRYIISGRRHLTCRTLSFWERKYLCEMTAYFQILSSWDKLLQEVHIQLSGCYLFKIIHVKNVTYHVKDVLISRKIISGSQQIKGHLQSSVCTVAFWWTTLTYAHVLGLVCTCTCTCRQTCSTAVKERDEFCFMH